MNPWLKFIEDTKGLNKKEISLEIDSNLNKLRNKNISINEIKSSLNLNSNNKKLRILCTDIGSEDNNGYGLFLYLLNEYKDKVEVRYITNNFNIIKMYPKNAFSWGTLHEHLEWCNVVGYSYDSFNYIPRNQKIKIFLQHGITWAKSDSYIKNILKTSTYAICSNPNELNYFDSLNTGCKCVLTGMPIYDYDLSKKSSNKNIVIMFTYRVNNTTNWISDFVNSEELKLLSEKYGYKIYFIKHHRSGYNDASIELPNFIHKESINKLGKLVRSSDILITDYSSIAFKAAYLDKSVYCYQPDYSKFLSDPVKPKGWYDWSTECVGYRSENKTDIFNKLIEEVEGNFKNIPNKGIFSFTDENNSKRVVDSILKRYL